MTWVLAGIAAYLIGSISFTRIVAAAKAPGVDLSSTDFEVEDSDEVWVYSGVSATTVLQKVGARWGLLVIVLDVLKALVPTWVALVLFPDESIYLLVGLMVVVGHIWPVYHRFRGGRGQSPMLGAMLVIEPAAIPFAIILGAVIGIVGFTSVYMARNGSALYIPIWYLLFNRSADEIVFAVALALVYLIAIQPDLREESRIRTVTGFSTDPWPKRLRKSTTDFFSSEHS